jgi:hypothetical protein
MTESAKLLYNKRKKAGLCISCGKNPARKGKVKCADCAEQHQSARITKCRQAADAGLCSKCHKTKAIDGQTKCTKCSSQLRIINGRHIKRLREKGICTSCGSTKALPNRTKCSKCAVKRIAEHSGTTYEIAMKLWYKQQGVCAYTGVKLTLGCGASIDHKTPKSRGGNDEASNLQWISDAANRAKLTMTDQEYRDFIKLNYLYQNRTDAVL